MSDRLSYRYLVLTTTLCGLLCGCALNGVNTVEQVIHCDMDNGEDGSGFFMTDHGIFTGWNQRYKATSHSGNYCMRLVPEDTVGFRHHLPETFAHEIINIQFWSNGSPGRVSLQRGPDLVHRFDFETSKGWTKQEFEFQPGAGSIDIVVLGSTAQHSFIDDFTISRIFPKIKPVHPNLPQLQLSFTPKAWSAIKAKRDEALALGNLITEKGDYQKVKINYGGREEIGKARLKGDWVDHLKGEKWSFRVKLNALAARRRMGKFSIHDPATRGNLKEWLIHQIAREQELLTTSYNFVNVVINGQEKGVFAVEGHFDQSLVGRVDTNGVVIRFSETSFWSDVAHRQGSYINTVPIVPFDQKRILRNQHSRNAFLKARDLLWGYQQGNLHPDRVFDIEKLARFYALTVSLNGTHALVWHNLRYYFNPSTQLLEPILYDAHSGEASYVDVMKVFTREETVYQWPEQSPFLRAFQSAKFTERFEFHMKQMIDPEYLMTLQAKYGSSILQLQSDLRNDLPFYTFNWNELKTWQEIANQRFQAFQAHQNKDGNVSVTYESAIELPCKNWTMNTTKGVLAYVEEQTMDSQNLRIKNVFCDSIQILGVVGKDTTWFNAQPWMPPALCDQFHSVDVKTILHVDQVLVKQLGPANSVLAFDLIPWRSPIY